MDFLKFYEEVDFDIGKRATSYFKAKQGDTMSRGFFVRVIQDGQVLDIATTTMKAQLMLPDRNKLEVLAKKVSGKFRVDIPAEALELAGSVAGELELYGSGGELITDDRFTIHVGESIRMDNSNTGGVRPTEFQLLETRVESIERYKASKEYVDNAVANVEVDLTPIESQITDLADKQATDKQDSDRKITEVSREFTYHKQAVDGININQETRQTAEGRRVVSLPKTAGEGLGEFGLQGLTATNLIENGYFRYGSGSLASGWENKYGAEVNYDAVKNTQIVNSRYHNIFIQMTMNSDFINGDKYYQRVSVKKTEDVDSQIAVGMGLADGLAQNLWLIYSGEYNINQFTTLSNVTNYVETAGDNDRFLISGYAGIPSKAEFDSVILINLTQTFGAGNEPTKEECDKMFANYFEGTQSVNGNVRVSSGDSTIYINAQKLRSLPNGIYDEVQGNELIKRVSDTGVALTEPEVIQLHTSGNLIAHPSGTVYVEDVLADVVTYGDKAVTEQPIYSLDQLSVIDFDTGDERNLDVSKAAISEDKLSFTHPELTKGDIIFFDYFYDEEGTDGLASVEYYDSRYTIKDSVTSKVYRWNVSIANGEPSIKLEEI